MNLVTIATIALFYIPGQTSGKNIDQISTIVTVQNECQGVKEKFLTKNFTSTELGPGKTVYNMKPTPGSAYPLTMCSEISCYRYGNMTFLSGRKYSVKISDCNLPGVRIESTELRTSTGTLSPKLRFRTGIVRPTEYRYDQTRFRRLSVGISSYRSIEWPNGESGTRIQFRHRLVSKGPVAYLSTYHLRNLKPGHGYFIEVKYYGDQRESIKIQDEGFIILPKK